MRRFESLGRFVVLCAIGWMAAGCTDLGDSSAIPSADGANGATVESGEDVSTSDDSGSETDSTMGQGGQGENEGASVAPPTGDVDAEAGSPEEPIEAGGPVSAMEASADAPSGTGAGPESGMAAGPESGADAGLDAGAVDATIDSPGTDASEGGPEDGGADSIAPDTGSDALAESDGGCPTPEACVQAPCGTNCIPCTGSSTTGVCSPTEAIIVNYDVLKNGLTAATPPSAETSCYYCMVASGCLDSLPKRSVSGVTTQNKQDVECDDPASASSVAATSPSDCKDALSCVLTGDGTNVTCTTSTPDMASTDVNASVANCYCGTHQGAACISMGPNGPCASSEATDLGTTDPTMAIANFTDGTQSPGAVGNQVLNCALTGNCNVCFK